MNLDPLTEPAAPWVHLLIAEADDVHPRLLELERSSKGAVARWIRGAKAATMAGLHDELSAALQFPPYYGANADALRDCLLDLSWLKAKQVTLGVLHASQLMSAATPGQFESFATIVAEACEEWNHAKGKRRPVAFHLVLQANSGDAAEVVKRWKSAGMALARMT